MSELLQVRIDEDLLKKIKKEAKRLGLSTSSFIRLSAAEKLDQIKNK